MAKNNVRVKVPSNPTDQIGLLGQVSAKHTALGASSPLGSLDWTAINAALAEAKSHDDQASEFEKKTEEEYGARDAVMPTVTAALRDARDLPLVGNRENPQALGDFGYAGDDVHKPKPNPRPSPASC